MCETVTLDRIAEYERIIRSAADWVARQEDIIGVAVVGSWARKNPRMDSDVDLVILTDGKEHCGRCRRARRRSRRPSGERVDPVQGSQHGLAYSVVGLMF